MGYQLDLLAPPLAQLDMLLAKLLMLVLNQHPNSKQLLVHANLRQASLVVATSWGLCSTVEWLKEPETQFGFKPDPVVLAADQFA